MHTRLLLIILGLLLQGCTLGTTGSWKNKSINKDKQEEIKILNDKFFKAIVANDIQGVKQLMSEKLIEKVGPDLDKLIHQVSSSFRADSYTVLDEYNVINSSIGLSNTLTSGSTDDNDYVVSYMALNKEMYVSLLLPNALDNGLLFTVIYGNYDDQWKINIMQFGQYSLFNKTAPEYFKLAKENYDKSYLIDAVNYISLTKQLLRPANDYLKYNKEKEINVFYEKIMKEVNAKYTLPLTINTVITKPKVFRIYPEMTSEGLFPMVQYLSQINLKDTTALKLENEKIKREIGQFFTGIDRDKKFVFYQAFNELPDGRKQIEHYGFIGKQEE